MVTTRDDLIQAYKLDLVLNDQGHLSAKNGLVFWRESYRDDVEAPRQFPYVKHGNSIYFLIPANAEFSEQRRREAALPYIGRTVVEEGHYYLPDEKDDWTDSKNKITERIVNAINAYRASVQRANAVEQARALLERERGNPDFHGSAWEIEDVKPTMVASLMLHKGVSVLWGPMDEFKSTFTADLAAHVSVGAVWQRLATTARPVIWYALEGADDVKARLKVLEARLIGRDTPWGNYPLPVTVRERIPYDPWKWRQEIHGLIDYWNEIIVARKIIGDLPRDADGHQMYPICEPLVIVDQLSLALNGEDEKGHKAAEFIRQCLDLTISNDELMTDEDTNLSHQEAASHVLILHHPTKSGDDIAGHRAIMSDTHGLYRMRRFGRFGDPNRPNVAEFKPMRVKGLPPMPPMTFEAEIVFVPGTKQTTTILKDAAPEIPQELLPVIKALRQFDEGAEIPGKELNEHLDAVIGDKEGAAKRQARMRARDRLELAGVLEAVADADGRPLFYRFHDVGAPR